MISLSDVQWGSYKEYEGPYFLGIQKFVLPKNPDEAHKRLAVLTATEGGTYDAVNMYDRCILSVGLIQWCEGRYFLVSKLLHEVAEELGPDVVREPLSLAMHWSCCEFKQNAKGQWRFHHNDEEVDTVKKQQALFLHCDGKDTWNEASKMKARLWVVGMANIWQNSGARRVQAKYTARRLESFATPYAKRVLWGKDAPQTNDGWSGMLRAAYLSFAANLSGPAGEQLELAIKSSTYDPWSPEWCIHIIRQLTFGANIDIYPHRYDKIRPVLEELWGVTLPKTSTDLSEWSSQGDDEQPDVDITEETEGPPDVTQAEEDTSGEDDIVVLRNDPVTFEKPQQDPSTPQGALGWILYVLGQIGQFIVSHGKRNT